jgi:hypothetical protein
VQRADLFATAFTSFPSASKVSAIAMDAIHRFLRRFATAKSPPVPYFAEYVLSAAELPPHSISFDKYPGLLLYYFVRPDRSLVWIATYWATREHFLRDGESFQAQIGAAPAVLDGYVDELKIPPEPVWKRVPWYTVVLGIAAFLGALQAIGDHFDWIFSVPHLELKPNKARINLIEGAEFQDTQSLVNQLPVAHRKIDLSASLESDSAREQKLNIAPSFVPHMPGSSPQEVTVYGVAPAPGSYRLVVNATASAGRIRSAKTFHFKRPITVWPKIPIGALSVKSVQRDTALLSGRIRVGPAAPNGLEC